MQRIHAHQLAELQEVRHASCIFERLVEFFAAAQDSKRSSRILRAVPESVAIARLRPASFRAMPHSSQTSLPSSRWNDATVRLPFDFQEAFRLLRDTSFRFAYRRMVCVDLLELCAGEVVADGVGKHEVPICQSLHQRARTEPVRAVIGEVGFADGV